MIKSLDTFFDYCVAWMSGVLYEFDNKLDLIKIMVR